MKTKFILFLLFLVSITAFGQKNPDFPVSSKVDAVKLFLSGAHVNRSTSVNLLAGTTTVVFKDLPSTMDVSTFQVEGEGAFTIMSIKEGYSNKPRTLPKVAQQIMDSITLLQAQKEDIDALQTVFDDEEKFLNQNRTIGGQQTGVKVVELKEATEFYRTRMAEIKKGLLANRRKLVEINLQVERLKARLYPYTSERVSLNQELYITVMTDKPTKGKLKVSYFTSAASWLPMYDIRSTGPGNPVHLVLKASASNATGENWENVLFTYSTGNPSDNVNPPEIYPWYLRPLPPPPPPVALSYNKRSEMYRDAEVVADEEPLYMNMLVEEADAGSMADKVDVQDAVTSVDYSIPIPYSIESGKDPLVVEIDKKELQADFEYQAIPKFVPKVYLMAKIANADRLNLLSANASVYLNNAYTGAAYLSSAMATDTLSLPLGQDNSVSITRNRIKDFKAKSFIGARVSETIGWDIVIRSLKSNPVSVKVSDQIPVSSDKAIKIETVELSMGKLNSESGIISWDLSIEPGKSQTLRLIYKVEYPKEMKLALE